VVVAQQTAESFVARNVTVSLADVVTGIDETVVEPCGQKSPNDARLP
jgi:hypothetical protein